jgi:uncharacterized protein YndB with AHSA1/START domain
MENNRPTNTSGAPELLIARTFNAPRALVFKVWTEAEHLKEWWGPKGFEFVHCTLDLRPGGLFHYCMKAPNGFEMWGKFVFQEVTPPERLAYIVSFSDAQAGIVRHPMSATWPLEVMNVVTFSEENGRTTLTMNGWPHGASEAECETFRGAQEGVQKGFAGTMEQLAAYLEKIQA